MYAAQPHAERASLFVCEITSLKHVVTGHSGNVPHNILHNSLGKVKSRGGIKVDGEGGLESPNPP